MPQSRPRVYIVGILKVHFFLGFWVERWDTCRKLSSLVEQFFLKRLIEDDVNRLKPCQECKLDCIIVVLFQPMCPCADGIERHTRPWYGDSLQAFLPRGFSGNLPWPEALPLLSIEPLLDPIQRRPTMQDR